MGTVALLMATACNRQLPPAPTPQAVAPELPPSTPPAQGEAQLIIDVVGTTSPVQRIQMRPTPIADAQGRTRYEIVESPELLCPATPCLVNLPIGNVVLGFPVLRNPASMDVELVHVGPEATVYRRSLSLHDPGKPAARTLGILSTTFGGTALATGAALLPIGLVKDSDGLALAGALSLGIGTSLTGLGIWALWGSSSSYRPGSAIHFSL